MVSALPLGPVLSPPLSPAAPASGTWYRRLCRAQVHRMWLVTCVVALLVLIGQYHVSTSWLNPGHVTLDGGSDDALSSQCDFAVAEVHEVFRAVLRKLVEENALNVALEARLLKEVAERVRTPWALTMTPTPPTDQTTASTLSTASAVTSPPPEDCPLPALRTTQNSSAVPPIYVITPTYRRPEQIAELTRLAQTLLLVKNVHWLVVEDSDKLSPNVAALLHRIGVPYHHLNAPMPDRFRKKRGSKPKGVSQRNRALQWLLANATQGTFYFADDDNTYDIAIFEQMRDTKRVSMWPVGLCTKFGLSTPVLSSKGSFTGFYDGWVGGRKFPVDMAGFAVSVSFLHKRPEAFMPFAPGFEEDGFLRSLAPFEPRDIELKADNCTKVLVWHTQTKTNPPSLPMDPRFNNTNVALLKKIIV